MISLRSMIVMVELPWIIANRDLRPNVMEVLFPVHTPIIPGIVSIRHIRTIYMFPNNKGSGCTRKPFKCYSKWYNSWLWIYSCQTIVLYTNNASGSCAISKSTYSITGSADKCNGGSFLSLGLTTDICGTSATKSRIIKRWATPKANFTDPYTGEYQA